MALRSSPSLGLKRLDRLDSVVGGRIDPEANPNEPEIESFMRIYNYESTTRQLDAYYGIVKRQLLAFQGSGSGLWAYNSTDKVIGDVRTSIYCSITVWGLYQAYRRIDDDRGRSYELSQSAVKCMRGILQCWLSQAHLIEKFKQQQASDSALHSKFHLETGDEIISEKNYGHLQIDVVSLYLIVLTQMINAGLQIIYTMDEVSFIQNLVYYVERAYRTPDYGIWERGNKYNNGTPEIHASSIGMAKSALEAVNGLNLFGDKGAAWSVVYVDIDAHNRNRSIFETLLPRESSSKNTDSSLIPTILFPAFATHDDASCKLTKAKVIRKLKGKYGFKRFLRDGYGSVLEDKSRRFYLEGETKNFENIESEWPIFYAYLVIDGIFRNDAVQVKEFQKLLKHTVFQDKHGDRVLPEYYYVPSDAVAGEKEDPGSQKRLPVPERGSGNLFLWGQSIYILSQLLNDGLLHVNELDPIRRYLPSYNRPRRGGRYSAFQGRVQISQHMADSAESTPDSALNPIGLFSGPTPGTASDLVVQVVLIVESMRLQAMMATYGIQTQTPHEVEPVQIWPPSELVKVYRYLGVSKKLGLDGRPSRPIGALGTSKIYRIWGQTVLCFPLVFEVSDFYLSHDMSLLIDDIRTELQFVGKNWKVSGRPTVCLLIREDHMRDSKFREMLDLLAQLKSGHCNGLKVRTGRLQNLIASSCLEHLDFLNMVDSSQIEINAFEQVQHASIGYQSLTDIPKAIVFNEKRMDFTEYKNKPTNEIVETLRCVENLFGQAQLLGYLLEREGPNFQIDKASVKERLTLVDRQAGTLRYWTVVRYCSTLLRKMVHSVSPSITSILVNGKQLTIGVPSKEEIIVDKPLTPGEFHVVLYKQIAPHDIFLPPLQQEILLYAGKLISTHPQLFAGILKFRVGWVLKAMEFYQKFFVPGAEPLEAVSPSEIRRLLFKVLTVWEWARELNAEPYVIRKLEGSMGRVPSDFFQRVWHIMGKASGGIFLCGRHLPREPTLSEMTMSEHGFALRIEDMIKDIHCPEYRHLVIEMILVMSTVLERNPELKFSEAVDIDMLVKNAVKLFWKDKNEEDPSSSKPEDPMHPFYQESFPRVTGYLARAVVNHILSGNLSALQSDVCAGELSVCAIA